VHPYILATLILLIFTKLSLTYLLSLPPTPFLWLHILGFVNRYYSDMLAHGSIGITFSQGRAIPYKWPYEYTYSQLMPLSPYPLIRLILNPLLRKRVNNRLPIGGGLNKTSPVLIPKGTTIAYSVYIIYRRPDLYGIDAKLYRPKR